MIIKIPSFEVKSSKIFFSQTPTPKSINFIKSFDNYSKEEINVNLRVIDGSTKILPIMNCSIRRKIYRKVYAALTFPIRIKDCCVFDARFETSDNIAHILFNVLMPYFVLKKKYKDITVLFRPNCSLLPCKEVFRIFDIPVIYTYRNVEGKILFFKEAAYFTNVTDTWHGFCKDIANSLTFKGYTKSTPERVFISRRNTRYLINEREVENFLKKFGFKKFYFEDIPADEQFSIAKNAKIVVGIHGASLSHLFLNNKKVKLIELFHPFLVGGYYRQIIALIGGKWCGIIGKIPPGTAKDICFDKKFIISTPPFEIDLAALKKAIEWSGIK